MSRRHIPILALVMAAGLAACGSSTEPGTNPTEGDTTIASDAEVSIVTTENSTSEPDTSGDGLLVVATTSVLGDVVRNVVGDAATVEVIMGPGTDPHDFQPSAQQAESIQTADLVVANGLGLEQGLIDVIEAAEAEGIPVIELAELLDPIPFAEHGETHSDDDEHSDEDAASDDDDEHSDEEAPSDDDEHSGEEAPSDDEHSDEEAEHGHGNEDPHFWQDPVRMARAAELIADRLTELDDTVDWHATADAYAAELTALDAEIEAELASIPEERRKIVTNHEAFGYFAERYDFEVIGTVIPGGSTLAEPSASDLADLLDEIVEEGVTAIFAENTNPAALADAVAAELGTVVEVFDLYSDSLGEPGSGADTYIGMLRSNAGTVAEALS